MTDLEAFEIMTNLNLFLSRCKTKREVTEAMLHCQNALVKQIPLKPLKPVRGSEIYCPGCGSVVTSTENYCWYCGQAIDWKFLQEEK